MCKCLGFTLPRGCVKPILLVQISYRRRFVRSVVRLRLLLLLRLSSSSLLLELLRDTLELDVVGRVRVFVAVERLTLVRDLDELAERLTLVRDLDELAERLTLVLSRDVFVVLERLVLDVVLRYCEPAPLLVLEEYERLDDVVAGRL